MSGFAEGTIKVITSSEAVFLDSACSDCSFFIVSADDASFPILAFAVSAKLLLRGSSLSRFVTAVTPEVSFSFPGNADDASFPILAFAVSGKVTSFGTLLSVNSWPIPLLS